MRCKAASNHTAVQPHMQPMADRAPLRAQACRATASRVLLKSNTNTQPSTIQLLKANQSSLHAQAEHVGAPAAGKPLHLESPNARASCTWWQSHPLAFWRAQMLLYMALAPEDKLTYAANGPQTSLKPLSSAGPQPTQQPSIHSATGTRRAAPPPRRASRAASRASRRARSAAAAW